MLCMHKVSSFMFDMLGKLAKNNLRPVLVTCVEEITRSYNEILALWLVTLGRVASPKDTQRKISNHMFTIYLVFLVSLQKLWLHICGIYRMSLNLNLDNI